MPKPLSVPKMLDVEPNNTYGIFVHRLVQVNHTLALGVRENLPDEVTSISLCFKHVLFFIITEAMHMYCKSIRTAQKYTK